MLLLGYRMSRSRLRAGPLMQVMALCTILLVSGREDSEEGVTCSNLDDAESWCAEAAPPLCNVTGSVGDAVRATCPFTCKSCLVSGGTALDKALETGAAVEYRVGMVLPEDVSHSSPLFEGWDLWLLKSQANTTGLPVGNGRVVIRTSIIRVTGKGEGCASYKDAARQLIENHKIDSAFIIHHNCKTVLSQQYTEAGVVHFVQSGTPLVLEDGSPYGSQYAWYVHLDSNQYPRLFLRTMLKKGHRKVAVIWWKGHAWTEASAKYVIENHIPDYDLELVYSMGWSVEQGGGLITATGADQYEEIYDTDFWDSMLLAAADAGAELLVCYSIGEAGSIIKRAKALGLSFKGIYMTVTPTMASWAQYIGGEGDYVVSPGQWHPDIVAPCVLFGTAQDYRSDYLAMFGKEPSYHSATGTAQGMFLQLALQHYNSTSPALINAALQTMDYNTMFGRVRFSLEHRNTGRDPVGMQRQDTALELVLPFETATEPLLDFVGWDCRHFLLDTSPDECSDLEYGMYEECIAAHPEDIHAEACISRREADERMQTLRMRLLIGAAVAGCSLIIIIVVTRHVLARRKVMRNRIEFATLKILADQTGEPMQHLAGYGDEEKVLLATLRGLNVMIKLMDNSGFSARQGQQSSAAVKKHQAEKQRMQDALQLRHDNLDNLLGTTFNRLTRAMYVVKETIPIGHLRDVTQTDMSGTLGPMERISIARDLVAGIRYLHSAKPPFVHGAIRAQHVLLTDRLTAKLRVDVLQHHGDDTTQPLLRKSFSLTGNSIRPLVHHSCSQARNAWQAPELLMGAQPSCSSDIYALGMTIWEIWAGDDPYEDYGIDNAMKLDEQTVKAICSERLRPAMPRSMPQSIAALVAACWDTDPGRRPTLGAIAEAIGIAMRCGEESLQKQSKLKAEEEAYMRSRHELVNRMLPAHIAEALAAGDKVDPEQFDHATIFFSDIVGYTNISSSMPPTKVMSMLDRLYHRFDQICIKYGLFKVETIGDAYMCAGGLPISQKDHAARIACFAREAVVAARSICIDDEQPDLGTISIRAGFHSGPVVASVVGDLQPRYCLFGDTVNTASRMESNSEPGKITMSSASLQCLAAQSPDLAEKCISRGEISIKGKGPMELFFLPVPETEEWEASSFYLVSGKA